MMEDSLKALDEIRYALDQAAIVAATDQRGIITYVNEKFCEISQYTRAELVGRDHRIINSGHHPRAFMRGLWKTIGEGRVWRGEIRNRAKDGSLYWVDTTIVPFLDGRGKPRQYLSIRSDITPRKIAETQLRQQGALATLGQLAAVVAHEVRNPLAGLRASLQILGGRFSSVVDRAIVVAMIARIDGLNAKVEDLLLYATPRPAHLQPVDVIALVRDVAVAAGVATGQAGRIVEIAGSGRAYADPEMLRAALLNICLNACQAAGADEVAVEVSEAGGLCRIAVRDRGPGIAPEVRDHLFEPFITTRPGGTGLGLAIVRKLLELQNGHIALSDRRGGGTVVAIDLPAPRGHTA